MNARPVFLKWSSAVFVVLLPFLAYSIWDVVEAARLRSRMQAVTLPSSPVPSGEAEKAARYYQAAAALVSYGPVSGTIGENNATFKALRDGEGWTPALLANARNRVDRNREGLEFADRAAALPFTGLLAGTDYATRVGALITLSMICEFRAVVLASDGDRDGALASLYSEARLARPIYSALTGPWTTGFPSMPTVAYVLERTKPSSASLIGLSAALADVDRDDTMKELFIRFRASILRGAKFRSWQPYPLATHNTVYSLDAFARLISASEQPWPERLVSAKAVGVWPVPTIWVGTGRGTVMLDGYLAAIAEQTKRIRCARLAIDGSLDLINPLSGRRLEMLDCHL